MEKSRRSPRPRTRLRSGLPESGPEGRRRVIIEKIAPQVDGGRYPVRRVPGEPIEVDADVIADGHEPLRVELDVRGPGEEIGISLPMVLQGNDRWTATFAFDRTGTGEFRIRAWVDEVAHWQEGFQKKVKAGLSEDFSLELAEGGEIVRRHALRAEDSLIQEDLLDWVSRWEKGADSPESVRLALDPSMGALAGRFPDPRFVTRSETGVRVHVERSRALRGAWYEFFPRSAGEIPGRHATLSEAAGRLAHIAAMGFDVVYLPPIHPIGHAYRKGPNNTPATGPDDPGSPWAIGSEKGGHTAIEPRLGTLGDFRKFVRTAHDAGLEVALDIAFQCSPDHPYVREHPDWFRKRPDGSIHYAENPPKKYQDIYPFDFLTEDWQALWNELRDVVLFWVGEGIRTFRVDNPHTKPFAFWEWLIGEVRKTAPDTVFLAEAFTRPKVMYHLAHAGFSQSYTFFTWKNTKSELVDYLTELVTPPVRDFFRPNLWPNTPDILHDYLQKGGRPAFLVRLMLAATLSASYGIYGPAYEWCENVPVREGSEEYLHSEKYEIRHWRPDPEHSLAPVITRINRIRREHPALGWNHTLAFHPVDNDQILAFTKTDPHSGDWILGVANLDPFNVQTGWLSFAPEGTGGDLVVEDLMTGAVYQWTAGRHFIRLDPTDPDALPFHILRRIP
uniref:Alpha-1,4-glucan:maltose-1-phosphate maltosyltransferase n=1 Tax=Leptospirillum ferriphilum TaxID=178606 RepID=A0A7C3QQQ8_9BACT